MALSSLHHVIDLEWMKEAYRLTRKDGAPGIDGVTADDYATNLEANLLDLLDRIRSGRYIAPALAADLATRPVRLRGRCSFGGRSCGCRLCGGTAANHMGMVICHRDFRTFGSVAAEPPPRRNRV